MAELSERRRRIVDSARRGFDAYQAGDTDTVLELLAPDLVLESVVGNVGTFHGPEGFLEWSRPWEEMWHEFVSVAERVDAIGDRHVVIQADQRARGRDGIEVTMRPAFAYEMNDEGLCSRMGLYFTYEEALAKVREWGAPAES